MASLIHRHCLGPIVLALCAGVIFLIFDPAASAQGVRGSGPRAPGPRAPATPKPAQPGGASNTPKTGGGKQRVTTEDLDEARLRERERLERLKKDDDSSGKTTPVPSKPSLNLVFEPVLPGDVQIISTTWKRGAPRGKNPFTVLKVNVMNTSSSYISVQSLILDGSRIRPLDVQDDREMPSFPIDISPFDDATGLRSPIPPRSRQDFVMALPFAIKPTSRLRAEVGRCVKFRSIIPVEWQPVCIRGWNTVSTSSGGVTHLGMFVNVDNTGSFPVTARLKISLADVEAAGGKTFFFATLKLGEQQRRSLIVRGIPDEGRPIDDKAREMRPETFKVIAIEVADVQF